MHDISKLIFREWFESNDIGIQSSLRASANSRLSCHRSPARPPNFRLLPYRPPKPLGLSVAPPIGPLSRPAKQKALPRGRLRRRRARAAAPPSPSCAVTTPEYRKSIGEARGSRGGGCLVLFIPCPLPAILPTKLWRRQRGRTTRRQNKASVSQRLEKSCRLPTSVSPPSGVAT